MKKLTVEERDAMRLKPPGKSSFLRSTLHNMKKGDIILLEPRDWNQKRAPSQLVSRLSKKHGKKFKVLRPLDTVGWVIERME